MLILKTVAAADRQLHGFEIADFHIRCLAHPGCVAVPAALAVAEERGAGGRDFVLAAALAAEVLLRVGKASGYSSVIVRSICAVMPAGVICARRAAAPPVKAKVGLPPGRLTTPRSRKNTPLRKPVPSALAHASLAAKRLA